MEDLPGFITLIIISFFTFLLSLKNSSIRKILFIALTIRIFFLLYGNYFIILPDSTADSVTFENMAWSMSQQGIYSLILNFSGPSNQFISWLIAIPYSLFGRSIIMAQSISLFFGICNVYLGWTIAKKIWNEQAAIKVAWVLALFPSLILYSVIIMKEIYVCFFLLVAFKGIIYWFRNNSFNAFILTLSGFVGATFFHGAMIAGAILFISVVGFISFKNIFKSAMTLSIKPKYIVFFLIFVISSGLYFNNKIKVPKLGHFQGSVQIDSLLRKTIISTRGDASYPEWTKINSPIELVYKLPVRVSYFLFAPFPWNVSKPEHIIGMIDSILYLYLSYLIFLNRKVIWKNSTLRMFLLILLCYIVMFSIGVGNFGTSVRHKAKFVFIFALLAAPLIKKIVLYKKKFIQ